MGQVNGQRLKRRRERFESLKSIFPHRAEEFDAKIADIDATLGSLHFCRKCGRQLLGEEAQRKGYGPECLKKSLSESADTHSQGRTPSPPNS